MPTPRAEILALAASLVRLEGVCEKRHKEGPDNAHVHVERVLRWGRQLAAIEARMRPDPAPRPDGWSLDLARERARHGVSWEAGSVPQHVADALAYAQNDRTHLLAYVGELEVSRDLAWSRMHEATHLWQQAHPGNDLVWPDLGDLLTWLMAQIPKETP